jgi:hypothetical protein
LPPFNERLLFWSDWSACSSPFSRCKFMRRRKSWPRLFINERLWCR